MFSQHIIKQLLSAGFGNTAFSILGQTGKLP